jgi:hypothetical protein
VSVKFLPYLRLTLYTDNTPEAVGERFASIVSARRFYLKLPAEPFVGSIRGGHFKVVPVLRSTSGRPRRNSWRPVVVGDIVRVPNGTEVRVRMRIPIQAAAFMLLWFGSLLAIAILVLWKGQRGGLAAPNTRHGGRDGGLGVVAIIGGMLAFGYLLMSVAFWTEAGKTKTVLLEALGCREARAQNRLTR